MVAPVPFAAADAGLLEGCLADRTDGGAALALADRPLSAAAALAFLSSAAPFAFHVCGFLFFKLVAEATLAAMRLVGLGIFSSDVVLKRLTMSLKWLTFAGAVDVLARDTGVVVFEREVGVVLLGACLYGET